MPSTTTNTRRLPRLLQRLDHYARTVRRGRNHRIVEALAPWLWLALVGTD